MTPVLVPDAATATATGPRPAESAPSRASLLAQALRAHDEQPDAARAAEVLRCCLDPALPGLAGGPGEASQRPALQALLAPADALVVYGLHGDELLACIVRRSRVQVFRRLSRWRELQSAWRLARFQLAVVHHGAVPSQSHLPKMTKRAQDRLRLLHELVWSPLADSLADARRLLLLPTAELTGLPFAALHDGMTCLAQRHLLAEVSSLTMALHGLQAPAGPPIVELAEPLPAGRLPALPEPGAPRVLACRWRVDDAVRAAFSDRFHHELRRGRRPAEALSEAQSGLMVHHPHPAFWSGFVLCGGW